MTLQTGSAQPQGHVHGELLRWGVLFCGVVMPASALGLRRVADGSPRKPVEIMAAGRQTRPLSVLHEAVIVAAVGR